MNAQDIVNALNSILQIGDMLDNAGGGISAMTNGNHTTRELCKMELGLFLMYVGDGGAYFNDAQAGLVNLVLGDMYGETPAWQMKTAAADLDTPNPDKNMTYLAFEIGDKALEQENGIQSTKFRDLLINIYEAMGRLMVEFNKNPLSEARYDSYINSLKFRMHSSGLSASAPEKPVDSGKSSGGNNTKPASKKPVRRSSSVDITPYIPDKVSLTDTQKDYLRAIVELIDSDGAVTSAQVAAHMNKTTSAVSSAVRTLMKKGILEINDDAKIVLTAGMNKKDSAKAAPANSRKEETKAAKMKTVTGGQLTKYNDRVSFALTKEYEMTWEKDSDGKDTCKITSLKRLKDTEVIPDTSCSISITENEDPDRELFDVLENNEKDESAKFRFHSDPEAMLLISFINLEILGANLKTSVYRLLIRLSHTEFLTLFMTSVASNGEEKLLEDLGKLTAVWRAVRIDGEAVELGEADTLAEFGAYISSYEEHKGKKAPSPSGNKAKTKKKTEIKVVCSRPDSIPDSEQYRNIHQVENEAEKITWTGEWNITVPPGYSYTMDPECTARTFLGNYCLQIQSTDDRNFDNVFDSHFSLAVLPNGPCLGGIACLRDLSSDDATDPMMKAADSVDNNFAFYKRMAALTIQERERSA